MPDRVFCPRVDAEGWVDHPVTGERHCQPPPCDECGAPYAPFYVGDHHEPTCSLYVAPAAESGPSATREVRAPETSHVGPMLDGDENTRS